MFVYDVDKTKRNNMGRYTKATKTLISLRGQIFLAPIDTSYVTLYGHAVVLDLTDVLRLLCSVQPLFPYPSLINFVISNGSGSLSC